MNPEDALIKYYGGKEQYSGGKIYKVGGNSVTYSGGKITKIGGVSLIIKILKLLGFLFSHKSLLARKSKV